VIIYFVLKPLGSERRLAIAFWYAFYFTIPFAMYDSIYCGLYLGYGIRFMGVFWFLSVYYLIPWVLLPMIAKFLNLKYK